MASPALVEGDVGDGIATVTLNRSDKLNAVTLELLTELRDVLADLPEDEAEGLVITGAGDVACSGTDREIVADPAYGEKFEDDVNALTDEIYGFLISRPYPTAMAARGALIGIGFILSLRCDFLVVGEETKLALPEVQYGIAATSTVSYLEEIAGTRAAKEIILTGEPVPPKRALHLGLANSVVPNGEVETAAEKLVGTVAERDSDVVQELKAAMTDPE